MSLRAYSEINLHITRHVKDNNPVLTDSLEAHAHRFLRGQVFQTGGAFFHEVGGTDDHIHLVASIQANLLISDWIGRLKGACSHYVNHEIANRKVLEWQTGYGVVVFGTAHLEWVKAYARNQRQHHAAGTTHDRLERTEPLDEQPKPPEEQTGQGPTRTKPAEAG